MIIFIILFFIILFGILILLAKITKNESLFNFNRMLELLVLMIFMILMFIFFTMFRMLEKSYLHLHDNKNLNLFQKSLPLLGVLIALCLVTFTFIKVIKKVFNSREKKSDYIKTKATVNSIELNNEFKDDMLLLPNITILATLRVTYNVKGKDHENIELKASIKNNELKKIKESKEVEIFISKRNHRNIYYGINF